MFTLRKTLITLLFSWISKLFVEIREHFRFCKQILCSLLIFFYEIKQEAPVCLGQLRNGNNGKSNFRCLFGVLKALIFTCDFTMNGHSRKTKANSWMLFSIKIRNAFCVADSFSVDVWRAILRTCGSDLICGYFIWKSKDDVMRFSKRKQTKEKI